MCVTFFYQSEIRPQDGYWLILANNRDELWDRPTKVADFWGSNNDCISGLDVTAGKEGGTWLGMNCHGKVGVLLNILGQNDPDKQSRGHLISNYISTNTDLHSYAKEIEQVKYKLNGFNLVLFDLGSGTDSFIQKPLYISNSIHYPSCVSTRTLPANKFLGVSNSPWEYPFQKVEKGKARLYEIADKCQSLSQKPYLIEGIFNILLDQSSLLPDPVMERATAAVGFSPARTIQHSAINVFSPQARYGSRTSTVILIDGSGQVDYVERTTDFTTGNGEAPVSTIHKSFKLFQKDQNRHPLSQEA